MSLADRRMDYETAGLDVADVLPDPIAQWWQWYDQAEAAGATEPNAMVVATVDDHGVPDARVVLVKGVDERGFCFYTNYESDKSRQLDAHPVGSIVFAWLQLHRQVRIRGAMERVSATESDDYYASRPRGSQIGAWASPQSSVLTGRDELERRAADVEERYHDRPIPRPPHWGGWRLRPDTIEFWQGRPSRLHDRIRYRLVAGNWVIERLAP